MDIDKECFILKQRLKWFINGINIHCIPWDMFHLMTAERICEIYNVDKSYFELA